MRYIVLRYFKIWVILVLRDFNGGVSNFIGFVGSKISAVEVLFKPIYLKNKRLVCNKNIIFLTLSRIKAELLKLSIHKLLIVLFILTCFSSQVKAADYYWVGNSGDWSDLSHWSASSGGAGNGYVSLPTILDNISIDVNSFNLNGQTITVDIDAFMLNFDFTSVTNTPTLDGTNAFEIEVAGSITFIGAMNHGFLGDYIFFGTSPHTITSAGHTFNNDIYFNGTGGTWTLADQLVVSGEIGLEEGAFDMAGFDVTAGSIDANNGTAARSIDFGGSDVIITDGGTCLDLRGDDTNLSLNSYKRFYQFYGDHRYYC